MRTNDCAGKGDLELLRLLVARAVYALALEQLLWFVGPLHTAIEAPVRPAAHHQSVGELTPTHVHRPASARREECVGEREFGCGGGLLAGGGSPL